MKKHFSLFLCSFASFCFSQSDSNVVIQIDKMRTLYAGIENPISIAVVGVTPEKISVTANRGTISGQNGKYIIKSPAGNIPITLLISVDGVLIDSCSYKLIPLPDPTLKIAGKLSMQGNIVELYKAELNSLNKIIAINAGFDYITQWEVLSFKMIVNMPDKKYSILGNSSEITDEMKNKINTLKTGDKLLFESIKVKGSDDTIRLLPTTTIVIK
jgi:hypothetical protein